MAHFKQDNSSTSVEDDDYEVFLFWPSLTTSEASGCSSYVIRGPVPCDWDYEEACPEIDSTPAISMFLNPSEPAVAGIKPGKRRFPGYSKIVKMGLILSQVSHKIDVVFDKVRVGLQKTP